MKRITVLKQAALVLAGAFLLGSASANGEAIYPSGYNLSSSYQLSDTLLAVNDTLTITRTIANNENFSLTGLYFSDNLPPTATIIDYDLLVGGVSMIPAFSDRQTNAVVSGYDTYWWQIDEPQNPGGVTRTVEPGETVDLIIRLVFDSVGAFSLPLHTVVFQGDTNSIFATMDPLYFRTFTPIDVDQTPPAAIGDLTGASSGL